MVDKPSTQVSIIALDQEHVEDQPIHKGMSISLSDQNMLGLISECAVELDPVQEFPPFSLIQGLHDLLHKVDLVGPSVTEPKLLEKVQSRLLDGGRCNSLVEGHEIRWLDTDLVPHVWNVLLPTSRHAVNIFAQLEAILLNLKNTSPSRCAREPYSNEDRRELGLLPTHGPTQPGLPYHYRMIGPDWVRFGEELEMLKNSQNAFTQKCLCEGRILVFCPDNGIMPPARWQREPYQYILNDRYSFVFAADLPKTWFTATGGPRDKRDRAARKEALAWLEAIYGSRSDHVPLKKKELVLEEMQQKFGLSGNAALAVWEAADIPIMKKPGRRSTKNSNKPER